MSDNSNKLQVLTRDELAALAIAPIVDELHKQGITAEYLIKKLKRELNAKESKIVKVKGAVQDLTLGNGRRLVVTSGTVVYGDDGGAMGGDGDSVIEWDEIAWGVRQRARQDAHKLSGHYPSERHEVSGPGGGPIQTAIDETERQVLKQIAKEVIEGLTNASTETK